MSDYGHARHGDTLQPLRALGVDEILLTLGSQGVRVIAGDTVAEIPASPTRGAVDPTGAGDSLSVVYVDGRSRGRDPAAAAERASVAVAELIRRGGCGRSWGVRSAAGRGPWTRRRSWG